MMTRFLIGIVAVLAMVELAGPPEPEVRPAPTTVAQDTRAVVGYVPVTSAAPKPTQAPMVANPTVVPAPLVGPDTPCQEWVPLAVANGWPKDRQTMETLASIMWRESRCNPDTVNPTDPNSGSLGLLQINTYWCEPSEWYPDGWLQFQGVLAECEELLDPAVNLEAGLYIYSYSLYKNNGNGWHPWRT
jgi:hypothetical protein